MKQYKKACEFCNATGYIQRNTQSNYTNAPLTEVCPVCNGAKTVIVTETN